MGRKPLGMGRIVQKGDAVIKHFSRNTSGRDFAVGDIHGCFSMLQDRLSGIGFDESRDRLFSVGDLVDRGPQSEEAIDWIAKPWFHAVRGNHEQMAIGVAKGKHDKGNYRDNGGAWFLRLSPAMQGVHAAIFDSLPLAIAVETASGKVGIVHADMPLKTWAAFEAALVADLSKNKRRALVETVLWSRERFADLDDSRIPDLRALVVGHTPMRDGVTSLGNVFFIDTGAVFKGGKLTVIDLESLPL